MSVTILDTPSRRTVLQSTLGSIFIVALPLRAWAGNETFPEDAANDFAPDAFIRIDEQGKVTLVMPQVEMGQGVYTSISMILAEELDADWSKVSFEHAPPNEKLYANPMLTVQATGNSNSIRAFWKPLRQAGANARATLIEAAAEEWRVTPSECRAESGSVIHDASGRRLAYGGLVERARMLKPVANAPLKSPKDFRLIGKPLKRLDTPGKTNGAVIYGIDAMPDGLKFATLAISPVLGGKVAHVDDGRARTIPGVRQIVVMDDAVAVVGDHMWAAKRGLDALAVTWSDGVNSGISTDELWERLRRASLRNGAVAKNVGDAHGVLADDAISADFEMPLLAHATMEPLNCTIHAKGDSAEVWIGTQVMVRVQNAVAQALDLPPEKVTVHNHLIGGGFGRRLEPDMAAHAARIAKEVRAPVKVIWTREEDMQHDVYRPAYRDNLSAKLVNGKITAWKHKVSGSSVMARWIPPFFQKGVDPDGVDSAVDMPYDIPNFRVEFNREEPPGIVTGFWRGVGPNNNVFAIESFIEELARRSGQDSIAFRKAHLDKTPRLKAVLDLVAQKSDWGAPLPARAGRGVAVQVSFASFIATVAEVEVADDGEVRLRRVNCVVDTGLAVNSDTIMAQLQGGLVFGLTAGLYGEVTLKNGRVQQNNFNDYRMLRINQVPGIDVHVVKSAEPPGGIGETGVTASIPALRNAIYAATGVPLRRMPVNQKLLAANI
ncbi:MAG TPA: molybdopterin cofactor-binding domain-containing protein [Rhizomicrobium sp.]|nr:molybdopterin cofactor-binding domain-containing protein [Rhizomicrobium sp.]